MATRSEPIVNETKRKRIQPRDLVFDPAAGNCITAVGFVAAHGRAAGCGGGSYGLRQLAWRGTLVPIWPLRSP